jgi:ABC-type lipoprotein release transport system permease subunit
MTARLGILVDLACRNLRRHVRRSILTSLALVIGGALLMFMFPMGDGTHEAWIESGVRMGSGHLSIQRPGFQISRKIDDRLTQDARAAAEAALGSPEVEGYVIAVSPQLAVSGLASSPTGARPIQIVGVESNAEAGFGILDEKTVEGRYLEPDDRLAAYVGSGLAEALDLRLGSRLVLTAQDASGEIGGQLVRVIGIFRTGVPEIDQSLVHIPLATAGAWLGTGGRHQIAVLVEVSLYVDPPRSALKARWPSPSRGGSSRSWIGGRRCRSSTPPSRSTTSGITSCRESSSPSSPWES